MLDCIKICQKNTDIKRRLIDIILLRNHAMQIKRHCHYKCSLFHNIKNIKYNNKYPFREVLGGHEFFSALFSFFNLFSTIYSFRKFLKLKRRVNESTNQTLHFFYKVNLIGLSVNTITWIIATFYHYNVNYFTMILDYLFAFLNLSINLYIFLVRIFLEKKNYQLTFLINLLSYIFILYALIHSYNLFNNFSFFVHKFSCSTLVLFLIMSWYFTVRMRDVKYNKFLIRFILGCILSSLVEISDIPPYKYIIDSHSIYHLISAPGIIYYYKYIIHDIKKTFLNEKKKKKVKNS